MKKRIRFAAVKPPFESYVLIHHKKPLSLWIAVFCGGGGRIRTIEAKRSRFTVCPLWPLGNSPIWNSIWLEPADGLGIVRWQPVFELVVQSATGRLYWIIRVTFSLAWLEPVDGLEPPTYWLQISCSTDWAIPAAQTEHAYYSTGIGFVKHFLSVKAEKATGRAASITDALFGDIVRQLLVFELVACYELVLRIWHL